MEEILNKLARNNGNVSILDEEEKGSYILHLCEKYGLSPESNPLQIIKFDDEKTMVYATRAATDQLRNMHKISVSIIEKNFVGKDSFYVVARATTTDGRTDEAIGAASLKDNYGNILKGNSFANALMTAETKAKRRVTLAICGLSFLDESEVQTIIEDKNNKNGHGKPKSSSNEELTDRNEINNVPGPNFSNPPITSFMIEGMLVQALEQEKGGKYFHRLVVKGDNNIENIVFAINDLHERFQRADEEVYKDKRVKATVKKTTRGLLLEQFEIVA